MMGFIFGIFVGIVLAETGCLPILQEYFSELFTAINNLKGDLYNGCDPSKMIRVSHSVPKGLKVGDVITFTYLNVTPKSMNAQSAVFLRLRNEED